MIISNTRFRLDLGASIGGLYVADRNHENTSGRGGILGYYCGVGKPLPYPEVKPFKPSLTYTIFNFIGSVAAGLKNKSDGLELDNLSHEMVKGFSVS